MEFVFVQYKDTGLSILSAVDDLQVRIDQQFYAVLPLSLLLSGGQEAFINVALLRPQVLLDDHIVKTLTMKGSPFVVPFEAEMKEWETKLVSWKFSLTFCSYTKLLFLIILNFGQ